MVDKMLNLQLSWHERKKATIPQNKKESRNRKLSEDKERFCFKVPLGPR